MSDDNTAPGTLLKFPEPVVLDERHLENVPSFTEDDVRSIFETLAQRLLDNPTKRTDGITIELSLPDDRGHVTPKILFVLDGAEREELCRGEQDHPVTGGDL